MALPVNLEATRPGDSAADRVDRAGEHAGPRLGGALAAGMLFGFGLALSTMIRPQVVLGFLRWQDLGLLLVLGSGVVVTFLAYRLAPRLMRKPAFGRVFRIHEASMARSTFVGAAIFGVGWGLTGVCPGPAIAGLGAGSVELLWSVAGLALGALIQGYTARSGPTA
jgi:uncharacterized membrane protein YedE/YeeE